MQRVHYSRPHARAPSRPGLLEGTGGVDSTDDEKEGDDNERTVCEGTAPPPYVEISSSFGLLERAAEECGDDNAAFHLRKARMAFTEARATKPVPQANISLFF